MNLGVLTTRPVKVNRDASLLGILDRMPGAQADFEDTKPFAAAPADDTALLFGAFGVLTLRASVVDVGSMRCTHTWHITEDGAMAEDPSQCKLDSSVPTAMAMIVHLKPAGAEQTLVRKLDPRCWAFAWPIDEHRVAVAQARYRLARIDHVDAHAALVRRVCDALVQAAGAANATPDDPLPPACTVAGLASLADPSAGAASLARTPAQGATVGVSARRPPGASSWWNAPKIVIYAVVALGLAAAVMLTVLMQSASALRLESTRLQAQVDATMTQTLAKTLAGGDYGEVQAALASLASLKYFERALVTNARGRVIATTGPIGGVRIGDPLAPQAVDSARVFDLKANTERLGRLLVWDRAPLPGAGRDRRWLLTAAMLIVLSAAVVAAVMLLRWRQRLPLGKLDR